MRAFLRGIPVATILTMMLSSRSMAANEPPTACFAVNPSSGTVTTAFNVDAGCSTDDHTTPSKLKVRWDWENDGVWDTTLSTTKTASHQYPNEGTRTIKVEVVDQSNLASTNTRTVEVLPMLSQSSIGEPHLSNTDEPDIDVEPGNDQHLVLSAQSACCLYEPGFVSTNGGGSWVQAAGPGMHTEDAGIEFGTGGQAYLMADDTTTADGDPQGVVVSRSTDGGSTYSSPVYAVNDQTQFRFPDGSFHAPCTAGDPLLYDYPKLAVDRNAGSLYRDNIYLLVRAVSFDLDGDGRCEPAGYAFIRSQDGGATWNSAEILPQMGANFISSVGVGSDGVVYIADPFPSASLCPGGSGVGFRKSVDGGATFQPGTCAYPSDGSIQPVRTWTATDPGNASTIYVAFNATVAAYGSTNHVYAIRSADAGATWSAPVRVDDAVPTNAVDHYRPSISVAGNGRVDVIWFDYRNSSPTVLTQSGQAGDVYYSYSANGGVTWSPNVRLSTTTVALLYANANDFLTVVSGQLNAYAAYSQDTNANGRYEALVTSILFH